MAEGAVEERSRDLRTRFWVTWGVVLGLIVVAFAGTVVALNSTVYSAHGFVGSYLDALARRDVAGALTMPGVTVPRGASRELLDPRALGELSGIRLTDDEDAGGGTHRVGYAFELDGTAGRTEFTVERAGARFGLFSAWRFAQSPSGVVEVTPLGTAEFDANGVAVESAEGADAPAGYGVLAPAVLSLGHDSELLVAEEQRILVLDPTTTARVDIRTEANAEFVDLVQDELDAALDDCTEQQVLQPTACPFGKQIPDRVEGAPAWSMTRYPVVTIVPGDAPDTWVVPQTAGTAHLVVGVRSLFDGARATVDEDVPFTVGYTITLEPGGRVLIAAG